MVNHTARRINYLAKALSAKTYLEIGVCEGQTFFDVDIPEKTGVDPNYHFDTSPHESESVHFFKGYSDAYFASRTSMKPFDIIFIDGLHKFEQVVRDFSNALLLSHPKTVIILDDTRPNDPYSAIPDIKRAMHQRKVAGSPSPAWHGDVFKTIFYIHDFFPLLDYRTIAESGNHQTIVWRSLSGAKRVTRLDDLEKISRLTYFDLIDNADVLREGKETPVLDLCIGELQDDLP